VKTEFCEWAVMAMMTLSVFSAGGKKPAICPGPMNYLRVEIKPFFRERSVLRLLFVLSIEFDVDIILKQLLQLATLREKRVKMGPHRVGNRFVRGGNSCLGL
jgi:hypothetical protein